MSDEVENMLGTVTPNGAPSGLRARVLAATGDELAVTPQRPRTRRRFPIGLATAAALLLGMGADRLADRLNEERLGRAFGPRPISPAVMELAQDVAEVAGPEAGRWAFERLSAPPLPPSEAELIRQAVEVDRLIRELTQESVENDRETATQKSPQVGRDRDRSRADRVLLVERLVHADDWSSA